MFIRSKDMKFRANDDDIYRKISIFDSALYAYLGKSSK